MANKEFTAWMIGKNGRLQTVPNPVGGCTVIIDESLRSNPSRNLIAAAPDLLAALQDITKELEDGYAGIDTIPEDHPARIAVELARAAIAKATS